MYIYFAKVLLTIISKLEPNVATIIHVMFSIQSCQFININQLLIHIMQESHFHLMSCFFKGVHHAKFPSWFPLFFLSNIVVHSLPIYKCNSSFLSQVYLQQHARITPSLTWFITMEIHQSHKQDQSINIVWFLSKGLTRLQFCTFHHFISLSHKLFNHVCIINTLT